MPTTRRTFLTATAAVAVTGGVGALAGSAEEEGAGQQNQEAPSLLTVEEKESAGITENTIAEAEKLSAIEYTPEERKTISSTIGNLIDQIKARREVTIEPGLTPATVFDPRLPGTDTPRTDRTLKRLKRSVGSLPANAEDIAFAPLWALSEWVRTRLISSADLTELYLERLKRIGPGLECVVTLTEDLARSQAAAADHEIAAGNYRGPLHGIPWGGKDLLDTKGIATTWGAMPYKDRVATGDAAVVKLLAEAGAVLVAKTTLGALAYGDIWFGGKTRNPWNTNEGSSGSSAGSASSTAAGLVGFSIGTETVGSIVSPSTRCGTTGLRPTFGRVPRTGAMTLCWSLDKIGAITRSVEDAALVLNAISAYDVGDAGSIDAPFSFDGTRSAEGLRVGYSPSWFENEDTLDLDRRVLDAARAIGLELIEIELPDLPYSSLLPILFAEAAASFEELTFSNRDDEMVWQEARSWPNSIRQARFISAVDFIQAQRFRRQVMEMMNDKFQGLDAMLSVGLAGPMLVITNYTGTPSLTIRAGFMDVATRTLFDEEPEHENAERFTVPHSATLWGRLYGEDRLCTIGMALEAELGVWERRPPVG